MNKLLIITALLPVIGYEKAAELIGEFFSTGEENMRGFLEKRLGMELTEKMFSPYRITALGHRGYERNAEGE